MAQVQGGPVRRRRARSRRDEVPASGTDLTSPLDRDRIARWFTESGFHYFTDVDGDLGGLWQSRLFTFLLFGEDEEILQIRAHWNREIVIERIGEILTFCNSWNAERIWPKTYVRVRDDGMIQVCAEVSVDLEHGVSDLQLDQFLTCGINSATLFFNALSELYPDPATVAP